MKSWWAAIKTRCRTVSFHFGVVTLFVLTILPFVSTQESMAKNQHPRLALIGAPSDTLNQAMKTLEKHGFRVHVNQILKSTDLILFVVSAKDGPMPQTREEISHHQGIKLPRAAILLIDIDASMDPELVELVVLEMKSLISKYLMSEKEAERLDVLRADDPELSNRVRYLLSN